MERFRILLNSRSSLDSSKRVCIDYYDHKNNIKQRFNSVCYNHLLISLICFHCVSKGLGYDAIISCAVVVSVSTSYSRHCILIDFSILSHILYYCGHMFSSWFIYIYSVDTVLYSYTLPINHFLHFYSTLCLSYNLSQA